MRCKPIRGTTAALDGEQGSRSAHLKYIMTADMTADSPSTRRTNLQFWPPLLRNPGSTCRRASDCQLGMLKPVRS